MKYLTILFILAGCDMAWAGTVLPEPFEIDKTSAIWTFYVSSNPIVISTENCPRMNGWEWYSEGKYPIVTQQYEYEWEIPKDTNTHYGNAYYYDSYNHEIFHPWVKVPYKIQWWTLLNLCEAGDQAWIHSEGLLGIEKYNTIKLMEIGLREDGLVIWRKPKQDLKDAEEREQRSNPYRESKGGLIKCLETH